MHYTQRFSERTNSTEEPASNSRKPGRNVSLNLRELLQVCTGPDDDVVAVIIEVQVAHLTAIK